MRSRDGDRDRVRVLVLMGGPDAERAVSIESGTAVVRALREIERFDAMERTIDRPTAEELAAMGGHVVFPVLHGHWGEGGPLQKMLEAIGVPFVGCAARAAALAMDKMTTKTLLRERGVATPDAVELAADELCPLDPPLVLKPVDDGSSVDIRICRTLQDVEAGRAELHPRRPRLMAERYIPGRELTVGILEGRALPIIEIVPAQAFYDYDAKYQRDDTRYVVDSPLPGDAAERCRALALTAFQSLGCRDVARVDFRLDADGGVWFLELNTMPGFTSHSLLPMAAAAVGLSLPALCARLVDAALQRAAAPAVP